MKYLLIPVAVIAFWVFSFWATDTSFAEPSTDREMAIFSVVSSFFLAYMTANGWHK